MFVKATNGEIVQYPYSIGQLRRDNPNTSFPKSIPAETLAAYGVYEARREPMPQYDEQTHFVEYPPVPVLQDGVWVFPASVVELSADQIAERDATKTQEVRAYRDILLAETDWVVVFHTEKGTNIPLEWEVYRQALRDITNHVNFPHLNEADWPVKP